MFVHKKNQINTYIYISYLNPSFLNICCCTKFRFLYRWNNRFVFFSVSWNFPRNGTVTFLGFHTATPRVRCVLWQWHKSPDSMAVWWRMRMRKMGGAREQYERGYVAMAKYAATCWPSWMWIIKRCVLYFNVFDNAGISNSTNFENKGFLVYMHIPKESLQKCEGCIFLDPWHLQHHCFFKLPNPPDWVELREQKNPPQRRCVGLVETDGLYRSDFPCPRFLVDILQDVQCEHCVSRKPLMSIYAVLAYVFLNLWLLNKKFGINSNLFPTVPHLLRHCQSILFGPFQHTLQWNTKRLHDSPKNTRGSNGWFKRWGEK